MSSFHLKALNPADWEPAELDGGQFCEVLSRIIWNQLLARVARILRGKLVFVDQLKRKHYTSTTTFTWVGTTGLPGSPPSPSAFR
jgi:hypothetical protein